MSTYSDRTKERGSPARLPTQAAAVALLDGGSAVRVADVVLPRRLSPGPRTPPWAAVRHMVLDAPTLQTLRFCARALRDASPLMLTGATSTAKTSALTYLAALTNWDLYRLNLTPHTDVSELVGRWVPHTRRGLTCHELAAHRALLSPPTQAILRRCEAEGRELDRIEQARVSQLEGWSLPSEPTWSFQEGPLVEALRGGGILLLDEVSLCPSAVIERINSVLEKHPTFVLSEADGHLFGGQGEPIHADFRVAATMNPDYSGRASLSPAFLNRFTSTLRVPEAGAVEYHQMLLALVCGEAPVVTLGDLLLRDVELESPYRRLGLVSGLRELLMPLASFHAKLELLTKPSSDQSAILGADSKQPTVYTRRDLLATLDRLAARAGSLDRASLRRAVLDVLDETYLQRLQSADRRRVADVLDAIGLTADGLDAHTAAAPLGRLERVEPAGDWQTVVRPQSARPLELSFVLQTGQTVELTCREPHGAAPGDVLTELFLGDAPLEQDVLGSGLRHAATLPGEYWARVKLIRDAPLSGELQVAYRVTGGPAVRRLRAPGGGLVGTVDGCIAAAETSCDYEIECVAGARYHFSTSPCSHGRAGQTSGAAEWDTLLEVLSPAGEVLASDDDSGVGMTSKLCFDAKQGGPHIVRVRGYHAQTGWFRLSVRRTAPPRGEEESLVLRDGRQEKKLTLRRGAGNRVAFEGQRGQAVAFATAAQSRADLVLSLRLIGPTGSEVGCGESELQVVLPADGRYVLELSGQEADDHGRYLLSCTVGEEPTPAFRLPGWLAGREK